MASVPGKNLNQENIMRKVFDNTTDSLKVVMGGGAGSVVIDAADDSIAIGDRSTGVLASVAANTGLNTNILGVVPVGGKLPVEVGSLNVTVDNAQLEISNDSGNPIPISDAGGSITVDAVNLDVRDLTFASDKVDVSNSVIALDSATLAALENTNVTVSNDVNLSATTLAALESISVNNFPVNQNVTVTNPSLAVTGDWLTNAQLRAADVNVNVTNFPASQVVTATDLDIRNLVFATDKVDVSNSVIALDSATLTALENTTVTVSNFPATQPVSGTVALDAPTLAALESISVNNFPSVQDVNVTNASIAVTGTVNAVQSGPWNITNITGTVSLPTGAATEATLANIKTDTGNIATNQLSGSQKSIVRGGAKGSTVQGDVTSTDINTNRQALDVAIYQDLPLQFSTDKVDVTGSVVALDSATLAALEDINVTVSSEVEIKNDAGNPVPVSAASLPLPTGAATSANQVTANASLASIDGKLTNLDIRDLVFATDKVDVSGSSVSITNSSIEISNDAGNPVPVSGTVNVTGVATEATLSAINGKIPANPSTDRTTAVAPYANRLSDGTSFYDARQIRSLTSADQITIANTNIAVTGPLTDVQLRASPVPISAASLPLPTGAATAANQTTANASLASIDTKLTAPLTTVVNDVATTPSTPANATVGVASAQIVAANASRKGLIITNTSNNRVFLAFGANTAVVNRGVALLPGGSFTMDRYTFNTQAVNAIATAAGSNVSIQEFA